MLKSGGVLLALALTLGGCAAIASAQEPETIVNVDPADAAMNAAKAKAIATLPAFYARLASPGSGESQFMIKFDILPGDDAEFVWANELQRSGGTMTGVLINQPAYTEDKLGDRVRIAESDIIDWAYFKGKVLQGGYTNRVLLTLLPPDQADALKRNFGW